MATYKSIKYAFSVSEITDPSILAAPTVQTISPTSLTEGALPAAIAITGTEFNDSIYSTADSGTPIEYEDVTTFDDNPTAITGLNWAFSEVRINNNSIIFVHSC